MRIERRLRQPWWLTVVVPVASLAVAFLLSAVVLLLTGHPPIHSFHRLFDAAFIAHGASATRSSLRRRWRSRAGCRGRLRMNLFNIGGEGQLYAGAITGATIALLMAGARRRS
jgi:simple sugar transport system permease protein